MEELELFKGAVKGAGEGGFVAEEHLEGAAAVGEATEGPGQEDFVAEVSELVRDEEFALDRVGGEEVGFDGGEAAETPAGVGQGLDEFGFEMVGGLELVEVGCAEGVVVFGGFGGEEDLFGGEAVFEGVLGRACFSFG